MEMKFGRPFAAGSIIHDDAFLSDSKSDRESDSVPTFDETATLLAESASREFLEALADLTDRWERGEAPAAETYLARARGWPTERIVELIYREFRLAETAGLEPSTDAYLARFPQHRSALEKLLQLDGACPDSLLMRCLSPQDDDGLLPEAGDEIGPYLLKRELGRGAFARVFLAEQADLENRLVVLKISRRLSREPWLLARARHANIVEIVSHAEVDDGALQMICMPFWGGAPLSAILKRRRSRPASKNSERRLLDDLDAESAPEYPEAGHERPAREILRPMTDARAFAWIVARLAEALDHAYSRDVAHGDVKPSNILITADGDPMLLDFNLAQDWSRDDEENPAQDSGGGTLAYMAPERLRAMIELEVRRRDVKGAPITTGTGPHQADVYSLGMVLLEAVAGWSPTLDAADRTEAVDGGGSFGDLARRYAQIRGQGGASVVGLAEAATGRPIPAALRSILTHCLEADPRARYDRALKLAEDLDRWRLDRPLAFAPEPSRRHTIGRWARRNRRNLAAGVVSAFVLALTTSILVMGDWELNSRLQAHALDHQSQSYDDPQSPAFISQRPGAPARRRNPTEATASALRALRDYKVLDDDDWRDHDDFRYLPTVDREEQELYLMEQALRYCRALADRPGSPKDWRRARVILGRACRGSWPSVLLALRGRLESQLQAAGATWPLDKAERNLHAGPLGIEEYLRGIAAELDAEDLDAEPRAATTRVSLLKPYPAAGVLGPDADDARPDGSRIALAHYNRLLVLRPDSFWGHYRSAVIAFGMGRWSSAAAHIETCLRSRPENPILRGFLSACLINMKRPDDALDQCNQALDAAPDHAEFFQTRAFIRLGLPQRVADLEEDLQRYELLKRMLPLSFFQNPTAQDLADPIVGSVPASRRVLPLAAPALLHRPTGGSISDMVEADPGELASRAVLASRIREAGLSSLAMGEIDKLLILDPHYIVARIDHMCLAIQQGLAADRGSGVDHRRFLEARDDLDRILNDPRLIEYTSFSTKRFETLYVASHHFAANGYVREALRLAAKTLELSKATQKSLGRSYYTLAQIQSIAARTEDKWTPIAAENLRFAIRANPDFESWFIQDHMFNPVRIQIRALLNAQRKDSGSRPAKKTRPLLAGTP